MLRRTFDPQKPYKAVSYLRMSDPKMNPRSPDQQDAEIRRVLGILRYPWQILKVYRDDGLKGALVRRRPAFQQMLQDIKSGAVKADLILLDTSERLGRTDELRDLRRQLRNKYGVLILTAHSQFCDPTTPQGKAFESFEEMRSTEENRVKAHQVVRSKRDLVIAKIWPGGPRPFGLSLVPVGTEEIGIPGMKGSRLEPFPQEDWIIKRLFDRAAETCHGQTRLTKYLNGCDDIPEKFKPFNGATVGRWLDQELYYGDFYWPKNCTGIVSDVRRVEANPDEEITHVSEFCPPIVDRDIWDTVQSVRNERRRRTKAQRANDEKLIEPLVPGVSLKYLLTGLVRCGFCGASMRPSMSGRTSKSGKTYCYYVCPRSIDGNCENKQSVPEEWLRNLVVERIRTQLFPVD